MKRGDKGKKGRGAPPPYFRFRPHPWHGLEVGPDPPSLVHAYIEITPFDLAKYEIDKTTGYLRLDRPQPTSSLPPTIYGFVPRTFCGPRVTRLSRVTNRSDEDPLDICVFSEHLIGRPEVLINARIVGGMHFVDRGEADDKMIAVLEGDAFWDRVKDLRDIPSGLLERLRHYFTTYKQLPGKKAAVECHGYYDRKHACKVMQAAIQDYDEKFSRFSDEQS